MNAKQISAMAFAAIVHVAGFSQTVHSGFSMDDHTKVHHANGVVGIEQIPGCAAGTTQ